MQDTYEIFRKRMKEIRTSKGVTLKELGEALGVKEATVQRYESPNGFKNIPYEKITGIADYLGVDPEYLMGWQGNPLKETNTDAIAKAMADKGLMEHIEVLLTLSAKDRKSVYDMAKFLAR